MTEQQNVNAGTRLGSMILDHFIMTMVAMIFFIPMLIGGFSSSFATTHQQGGAGFGGPLFYLALLGFVFYFCKDVVNGRSIGKRIVKTQVVNNNTGEVASPLKCFVRNIFCIIWPVEVIVTLINPGRRIGDIVAGTKVVFYDPVNVEQPTFEIRNAILPFAISYGFVLLLMLPFQSLQKSFTKVDYVESSYNDRESKALEKIFSDSLGQNLTASVKIYDKTEQSHLQYISVIYILKENYLVDETSSKQLRQATEELLYSTHPKETFTGHAKYVFNAGSSMQSSSNQIGATLSNGK